MLYREDCLNALTYLQEGSTSVIVTSPPYNIGMLYNEYQDNISRGEYLEWTTRWGFVMQKILAPNGSFFLNISGTATDPLVPYEVLNVLLDYFTLQNTIHWIKSIHTTSTQGHFKPINSKRFINQTHEYIFHLTHSGDVTLNRMAIGVPYTDKTNINRWNTTEDLRCRGNCWFIPYKTTQNAPTHPATFPQELASMCIKLHGVSRTSLVVDPFMGVGTTALACVELNVPYAGFEIDSVYHKISEKEVAHAKKVRRI